MATPERNWKHIQRQLRSIPVDQIGPRVAAWERDGLWCLVANELVFVPARGGTSVGEWDDFLEYAQFVRYVRSRPERVHPTHESALTFVRSQFGRG